MPMLRNSPAPDDMARLGQWLSGPPQINLWSSLSESP